MLPWVVVYMQHTRWRQRYHLYIRTEHECSSANLGEINYPDVAVSCYKEKYAKFEVLPDMIMKKLSSGIPDITYPI
jgi:hypothetical protein